ncbi:phosphatase inhibitor [Emericellopsis cladophorae]|uniref:Type 1 phosphatases regulator n=1 Tax=Emericellopsis cladophorae TaxID=2686198 RepID=A0A9P9XZJ4_9HYPO|nr:phosphatase inhibitor [Emericellopsis cladophorae]KAI6780393.1 phosphatase inhibitor [Emericellopsis cladophorae]
MSGLQSRHSAPGPSQTQTTTEAPPIPLSTHEQPQRVLRLRGARNTNGRSVQWAEDVVDNEGLGRKSSKVCCIYHKPKAADESSDESDTSSSSGEDSETESKPEKGKGACSHGHGRKAKKRPSKGRAPSPNAYEKVPKVKPREEKQTKA